MTSRQHTAPLLLCTMMAALVLLSGGLVAEDPSKEGAAAEPDRGKVVGLEEQRPPVRGPVPIRAPRVRPLPAAGHGRLSVTFDGNRRWCTFPDDRLRKAPTRKQAGPKRRREVFTFGYQLSFAAVDRSRPGTTLLLFESPVVRTATLRQAGKLGRGKTPGRANPLNPSVVTEEETPGSRRPRETTATLVPYWDEPQRCATVDEQFDFDLEPGIYDLYLSFDIMMPSGNWIHRTYAYLTGIEIVQEGRTVVDGVLEMRGGGRRDLQLRSASIESPPVTGAARH